MTALASLGCAGSPSSQPGEGTSVGATMEGRATDINTGMGNVRFEVEENRVLYQVQYSTAEVWPALVEAFSEVGIELDVLDPPKGQLGMQNQTVSRRFAGERPGTYLRCGDTMAGPVANASRIQTTLLATMESEGAELTNITFFMQATARLKDGADKDPKRCSSTRKLEADVSERPDLLVETPAGDEFTNPVVLPNIGSEHLRDVLGRQYPTRAVR